MIIKKISYLFLVGALLFIVTACSNYASYSEPLDAPARYAYENQSNSRSRNNPRGVTRSSMRRGPITRGNPSQSAHQPRPMPETQPYVPAPQAIQAVPHEPAPQAPQANLHAQAPPATKTVPPTTPPQAPPPATGNTGASQQTHQPISAKRELSSHKTEFDAKDDGRTTNITRASNSINGHVVQPGETFSYNETVGPTIERRGYKEGIIFVDGEKKKGFGGGVCQVSTTLCIAADEAGMTITERHDHSRPVSYAKEGEEAATSYGGIDFKFKNEKPFPVVINSSVEGGTILVSICEA